MKYTRLLTVLALSLGLGLVSHGMLGLASSKGAVAAQPLVTAANRLPGQILLQPTTVMTLSPSKDNTLYESAAGALSNGAGQNLFVGLTGQPVGSAIRRGLIAFDISGNIPAGAVIMSVTLKLNLSMVSTTGTQTVTLHRLLADWGEGTSVGGGPGAPATMGDATWRHTFFDTEFWAAPGGVFSPTARAATAVGGAAGLGFYQWTSAHMAADVQGWLDNPVTSFGWAILGDELQSGSARQFDTRENSTAANRPALVVEFLPPMRLFLPLVLK